MDGLLVSMLVLLFISLFVWTNHLILFVQNLVRITWCQDKSFLVIASTLGPQGARSTRVHWQPPSKCQTVAGTVNGSKCTMERRLSDILPLDSRPCSSQCIEVQISEQSSVMQCINLSWLLLTVAATRKRVFTKKKQLPFKVRESLTLEHGLFVERPFFSPAISAFWELGPIY